MARSTHVPPRRRPVCRGERVELGAGLVLLAAAGVTGVVLVHRPWPNRLDAAGFAALPAAPGSVPWHDVAAIGSLPVLLAGIGLCVLATLWRDRARALACVLGPGAAVVVTERVAKPLVGRHLGVLGGNSYPSGTVTAAAALACVVVLVTPRRARPLAAAFGIAAVAATGAAVVAMRWHFPTDALGGALVGAGAVLVVDAVLHAVDLARRRTGRSGTPRHLPRHGPPTRLGHARAS